MEKLNVSKDLKIGKQEILLDPNEVANKCGFETDPLLLNDLYYKTSDGTVLSATEWILQEKIEIEKADPAMVVDGQNVTIKWVGTNDVKVYIDGSQVGIDPSGNKEHTQAYLEGHHSVLVQCIRDRRGLTYEFDVTNASESKIVSIKYGEE
jgi:hypothetical protein